MTLARSAKKPDPAELTDCMCLPSIVEGRHEMRN